MNSQRKWFLFGAALLLVAGTGLLLGQLRHNQKLGAPGVKTRPIEGSIRLEVELPEQVLNCTSEKIEPDEATLNTLPKDTSFGQRRYISTNGFWTMMNVVLMGTDRTSLHKPQFCLTGQGFQIDASKTLETKVRIDRPYSYDLPVVRLVAQKPGPDGQPISAIYVYWFVSEDALSASVTGFERMWWMAKKMVTTGVLQRWAYVSCLSACRPGHEDATFEQMKPFIAAAVPEFQLTPRAPATAVANARP